MAYPTNECQVYMRKCVFVSALQIADYVIGLMSYRKARVSSQSGIVV